MKPASFHGLLVLDKPGGMTSRDVVDRVQRWFPRDTRIGHTGTLDPLATGVLVLVVGAATRLTEYVQRMDKTYRAGLLLDVRSDTDDVDGTLQNLGIQEPPPTLARVARHLQEFIGALDQVPPAFSAAKVTGRRAYEMARRGQAVVLEPRRINIYTIDLLKYDYPRLDIEVRCGKGTYIRSLARDFGERLGRAAVLETLRRTRVGPFDVGKALHLETEAATARSALLPLATAVVELPRLTLEAGQVARLRQGQGLPLPGAAGLNSTQATEVAVLDPAGSLAAIVTVHREQSRIMPIKVLPEE